MAVLYGNSTGSGYWRVHVYYDVYGYDTYYAFVINVYRYALKKDTSGYDARTDTTSATAEGTLYGTPTWNHASSAGQERWLWGTTINVSRGTTARNITVGGANTHPGSHTMSGSSSAYTTYTIPALVSYPVSYNANGGTNAPDNQIKYFNTALTLTSKEPTRKGYTFTGWNTAADGSGTPYSGGSSYTDNAALALYAQWTVNTYTVVYNSNGATSGSMSNSTFTYDVDETLKANQYTRTDYLFTGWNTAANGSGASYANSASVRNLTGSGEFNLYAMWRYQYTPPEFRSPNAERATNGVVDSFGTGAILSVYVVPGQKESSIGQIDNTTTDVYAYYRQVDTTEYTQVGTKQTITSPTTLTWNVAESTINTDLQYEVLFTAATMASSVSKAAATPTGATIPIAEFLIDMSPDDNSIGIFTIAPEEDNVIMIGKGGDVVLELDYNTSGTLDERLLTAFARRGWTIHDS